ncbi:hypothetical protein [Clostridium felsineum]|nr:hypothetical protein [Clostridium felsineum]URZ01129.1 hypothetical protein CLAUR_011170 [Clostridium felsineum]
MKFNKFKKYKAFLITAVAIVVAVGYMSAVHVAVLANYPGLSW